MSRPLKRLTTREKNDAMAHYLAYDMSIKDIAKKYGVTTRTIQRWAGDMGIVRELRTAQSLSSLYRDYASVSRKLKLGIVRTPLPAGVRARMLEEHPYCAMCGATTADGVRLEIDHIDNDPSNHDPDNLQVLCSHCNIGKFHAHRREYLRRYRGASACES